MRRQVTHEPVCIFKRWLWLLVENKLYGAKGKAVGRLLIRAFQVKDAGDLGQVLTVEMVRNIWVLDVFLTAA